MSSQACYPHKSPRVSELLDVLSHNLRREVIHFFESYTGSQTVSFDELVLHVQSRVPEKSTEEIEVGLAHTHLPKLAHAGWLEYDRRTNEIRYHGHDNAEQWLGDLRAVFAE